MFNNKEEYLNHFRKYLSPEEMKECEDELNDENYSPITFDAWVSTVEAYELGYDAETLEWLD